MWHLLIYVGSVPECDLSVIGLINMTTYFLPCFLSFFFIIVSFENTCINIVYCSRSHLNVTWIMNIIYIYLISFQIRYVCRSLSCLLLSVLSLCILGIICIYIWKKWFSWKVTILIFQAVNICGITNKNNSYIRNLNPLKYYNKCYSTNLPQCVQKVKYFGAESHNFNDVYHIGP